MKNLHFILNDRPLHRKIIHKYLNDSNSNIYDRKSRNNNKNNNIILAILMIKI